MNKMEYRAYMLPFYFLKSTNVFWDFVTPPSIHEFCISCPKIVIEIFLHQYISSISRLLFLLLVRKKGPLYSFRKGNVV